MHHSHTTRQPAQSEGHQFYTIPKPYSYGSILSLTSSIFFLIFFKYFYFKLKYNSFSFLLLCPPSNSSHVPHLLLLKSMSFLFFAFATLYAFVYCMPKYINTAFSVSFSVICMCMVSGLVIRCWITS